MKTLEKSRVCIDQTVSFLFIGPIDNIKSELTVLPLLFNIIIL